MKRLLILFVSNISICAYGHFNFNTFALDSIVNAINEYELSLAGLNVPPPTPPQPKPVPTHTYTDTDPKQNTIVENGDEAPKLDPLPEPQKPQPKIVKAKTSTTLIEKPKKIAKNKTEKKPAFIRETKIAIDSDVKIEPYYNKNKYCLYKKQYMPHLEYRPLFVNIAKTFYYKSASSSFDCSECKRELPHFIFGTESFSLEDVYLAARLARQEKLSLNGAPFGDSAEEQYLASLASTQIKPYAKYRQYGLDCYCSYILLSERNPLIVEFGVGVPIVHIDKELSFSYINGCLMSGSGTNMPENNLFQFFNDYVSFEDFFISEVLLKKNLKYHKHQSETSVGDIFCNLILDFTLFKESFQLAQHGIRFFIPTSKKKDNDILWPIQIGNEGRKVLELFTHYEFYGNSPYLNPHLSFNYRHSFSHRTTLRIPTVKNSAFQVLLPCRFSMHEIEDFCEFDTCMRELADNFHCVELDNNHQFVFRFGNHIYPYSLEPLSLFIGFSYKRTKPECITPLEQTTPVNTRILESATDFEEKLIHWNLALPFKNSLLLELGGDHTIGGKNIPIFHQVYLTAQFVF